MANAAYKVKQDITIPRAVSEEEHDGETTYTNESVNYGAGDYVLEENISPPVLERVQAGDLEDFLESADREEAESALRAGEGYGTFIAEHSAEAFILDQYGHTVVPREQVVEAASAGVEDAAKAAEEAKADDADARDLPGLPEEEVDEDQIPDERPPGITVGGARVEASGGEVKPRTARARPAARQSAAEGQAGAHPARSRPAQAKPE
jgi:hypothetical protein